MVQKFKKLGCLMNLKLHFLDSHIDEFPPVLGDYSEEQGERFHQDMKEFERRWRGKLFQLLQLLKNFLKTKTFFVILNICFR